MNNLSTLRQGNMQLVKCMNTYKDLVVWIHFMNDLEWQIDNKFFIILKGDIINKIDLLNPHNLKDEFPYIIILENIQKVTSTSKVKTQMQLRNTSTS